jgi:hypothetical protein
MIQASLRKLLQIAATNATAKMDKNLCVAFRQADCRAILT